MKKLTITLVISLLISTVLANFAAAETTSKITFTDVKDHWAESTIYNMVELNIVDGFPNGTFRPEEKVTRAQFIKMVIEAADLPKDQPVVGEQWYETYVRAAVNEGIHRETDFKDNWNKNLTRMEMVRLAVRATDDTTLEDNAIVNDRSFMVKATTTGLIHGMADGSLNPEGLSTRAQAVTVIERILDLREGKSLDTDQRAIDNAEMDLKLSLVPHLSDDEIWDEEEPDIVKLEVAKYYEMQVHDSLYVEDGNLHGYLPVLPGEFEYGIIFTVFYDPKDEVTATNNWPISYKYEFKQGEYFSIPVMYEDKVKKMELNVGIYNTKDGSKRRFSVMDFYNNKEITEYIKY